MAAPVSAVSMPPVVHAVAYPAEPEPDGWCVDPNAFADAQGRVERRPPADPPARAERRREGPVEALDRGRPVSAPDGRRPHHRVGRRRVHLRPPEPGAGAQGTASEEEVAAATA